jgi:hypothetical protein
LALLYVLLLIVSCGGIIKPARRLPASGRVTASRLAGWYPNTVTRSMAVNVSLLLWSFGCSTGFIVLLLREGGSEGSSDTLYTTSQL